MPRSIESAIYIFPLGHQNNFWISEGFVPYINDNQTQIIAENANEALKSLEPHQGSYKLRNLGLDAKKELIGISIAYAHPGLISVVHSVIADTFGVDESLLPKHYNLHLDLSRSDVPTENLIKFPEFKLVVDSTHLVNYIN